MGRENERRGEDAITASLRIISYRPRSEAELRKKLLEKGFDAADISDAVDYLAGAGYIDDDKYAAALAESRTRNKGWGPAKIAADLARKGISKDAIARAIEPLGPGEEETAASALSKWARKNGVTPPLKDRLYEKAARHLKARGFSTGVIIRVIKGFSAPDEDTD